MNVTTRIYKYPLAMPGTQRIVMDHKAKILSAHLQGEEICVWAQVTPSNPQQDYYFTVVGTGQIVPDGAGEFVGTVLMREGVLVWHIFCRSYMVSQR